MKLLVKPLVKFSVQVCCLQRISDQISFEISCKALRFLLKYTYIYIYVCVFIYTLYVYIYIYIYYPIAFGIPAPRPKVWFVGEVLPNSRNRINYFKSKITVQFDGEGRELWHFLVGVLKLGGCVDAIL